MRGLVKGLKELHENNIMHRDIKPENLMLRDTEGMEPVIVDFGLAADVTTDDYIFYRCGTPGYVAPEVITLNKGDKISPVCDIFSAGAIFHILLMARPLFAGTRFEEVYENNRKLNFNLRNPEYSHVDREAIDLL
jgi:calcium-dependent protein kinase